MTHNQAALADQMDFSSALPSPKTTSKPVKRYFREYVLPALLLFLGILTTTASGARFMQNFLDGLPPVLHESDLWPWPWLFAHPERFKLGWPFSLALLTILLTHEFGHYFACRIHKIRATLPWVLPAPTLSGTAGAIIQLRSPIPNRRALMDVGVYGPLAGYCTSLIVVAIGLLLSHQAQPSQPLEPNAFGQPLTLHIVHSGLSHFFPATPSFGHALRHPVLIAGWIGLFITSLNLIPGGQLDGGHILYAISPPVHRWATRLLPVVMLVCGLFYWVGWLVWGVLLLIPAMRHPRVPIEQPLRPKHFLLSALSLAIFILSVSYEPFAGSSLLFYLTGN